MEGNSNFVFRKCARLKNDQIFLKSLIFMAISTNRVIDVARRLFTRFDASPAQAASNIVEIVES